MQEPKSAQEVAAFEDWLSRDSAHAAAYAEIEAINKAVSKVEVAPTEPVRGSNWRLAMAAAVLAIVVATGALLLQGFASPAFAAISNPGPAVRGVHLSDGTRIWLDAGAEIGFRLEHGAREISIRRGRVRITPASERRLLRVTAGEVELTPSSVTFDASVGERDVLLGAIGGPIHVEMDGERMLTIATGQGVAFDRRGPRAAPIDRGWPMAKLRFTGETLGRITELANRQAGPDIVFADPAIARLRVTGVLDLRDTRRLARKLAAAHGLRLREDGRRLILG